MNLLSLFSGCGGMDIGFEGGFICHAKSIDLHSDFVADSALGSAISGGGGIG